MLVGHGRPHTYTNTHLSYQFPCECLRYENRFEAVRAWLFRLTASLLLFLSQSTASVGQTINSASNPSAGLASPSSLGTTYQTTVQCELRVVWGGNSPRPYSGMISIAGGTVNFVRNLSLQQDSIGSISDVGLDRIELRPHSPSTFGGVDIAVRGQLESLVNLRIDDPLGGKPREFQVPLADLLENEWIQTIDERGNRLAIGRQLVDRLRVVADKEPRIFSPHQTWRLQIAGHRTGLSAGAATMELQVFGEKGQAVGQAISRLIHLDQLGNFPSMVVELSPPSREGAYHLEISLHRRNVLSTFVATAAPLTRRLDFVVFDGEQQTTDITAWKLLATIDPLRASKPGSLAWLASMEGLPSLGRNGGLGVVEKLQPYNPLAGVMNQPISHGSLGSRELRVADATTGQLLDGSCLSLAPQAWLALPLHGLQSNTPHRLRVRAPTDQAIELAISVQQTNVLSEFPPLSLDSAIIVQPRQAAATAEQLAHTPQATPYTEHEIVFWPRGEQAYILLANMHSEQRASVCDVWLERAEVSPPLGVKTLGDSELTKTRPIHPIASRRMIGINVDKPLLADCVSAEREVDALTGRALETWRTWQQSMERICLLMRHRKANTLFLKGFSEGGGIFPSEQLSPNYRYDNGTFFSDGRSPEIKDAIELALRHFDRAGFQLILALDLNTALPMLRRFEHSEGQESLLQQPLSRDQSTPPSGTPRYNPLNGRVQQEFIAALRDIVKRYEHHPAFAGIAIQLDDQSQLLFAGDRWGYDPQTLSDFEKAMQVKLPPSEDLESSFRGSTRLAFLDWRAGELSRFYGKLGEIVRGDDSNRKLYLNPVRLWDNFPSSTHFFNPDEVIRNPREYMLAFGIAPEQLAEIPSVELMRGSSDAISNSVNAQDWIRRESGQRGLVEFFAGADTAAMVLRYPRRFEIPNTEKLYKSRARWIYPTLTQPGAQARQKLINQVFHSDPLLLVDGGWLPFSGQDNQVNGLMSTLGRLPPVKLKSVALRETDSNLCVRLGHYKNKSYLQIINNASWEEALKLGYQTLGRDASARTLADNEVDLAAIAESTSDGYRWSLQLAPYEMVAIEVDDPQLSLTSLQHTPSTNTSQRIASELAGLENLVLQSADLAEQRILANVEGDFELWNDDGQPHGWSVSSLPQVTIAQSNDLPHTGSASLLLENRGKSPTSAWAQSRPIAPPRTGRLAVQAWFRAPAVGDPLLVKLSLVGRTHSGQRFERSLELGARAENPSAIAIDWGRKPATLFVGDVSSESVAELSVSIELIGPGKVWVDDVQVFESLLQPNERNHLRGELLVAQKKLAENNLFPAERLLDSHWGQYLFRFRPMVSSADDALQAAEFAQPIARMSQAEANNDSNTSGEPNMTPVTPGRGRNAWSESPSVFRQMRESLRNRWQQ